MHNTNLCDILVIGCGGAGLRAAIEAKKSHCNVKILGKRKRNDSHTVLAAGGINASFGNLDKEDSWIQHFIDTYEEGYGIGDPDQIEILVKESTNAVKEIDYWGANLDKLQNGKFDQRFFGAHTFRRTCFSGDYTGKSILKALLKQAAELKIPIQDDQYVTDLLVEDDNCYGAMSLDINTGNKNVYLSKAVILSTGGHTCLWERSSSRKYENNGDGCYLALKAGVSLIDMEMVQFHQTGMAFPEEHAGTLVTEAVRGEGGLLFNKNGERFMINYDKERMELSTRDRVAIANFNEIMEGRGTKNSGVFLDISHKDKDFIIKKIPKIYQQFLDLQNLDISKEPMEVSPTAHYSMGGLEVNPKEHSTIVRGLYAAGEVAGGLHGANRLGGNSLSEILVFGKLAGIAASNYCKNLNSNSCSEKIINNAKKNIDIHYKIGTNNNYALQKELQNIMWIYCGVRKSEKDLKKGLDKLRQIKSLIHSKNINTKTNNIQNLIDMFNLEASLYSAEATILSSIERKESRGAHQRSDYNKINESFDFNILIKNRGGNLICYKRKLKKSKLFTKNSQDKNIKPEEIKKRLLE